MNTASPTSGSRPEALNGDLGARAIAHTQRQDWTRSPSGTVFRKRVHRVGPEEAGQVTSVVRYVPGAQFPAHDHPDGEEILVLEGTFSDEHGDWPAGTYLLNPEGFRHAPFSKEGCLLFVKLRQFAGTSREHVALDWRQQPSEPGDGDGILRHRLYEQEGFADTMSIEVWPAGSAVTRIAGGSEIFVIEGAVEEAGRPYEAGSWIRLPEHDSARLSSATGATLYLKRGGLAHLWSDEDASP